jgi:hypothetical protein
MLHRDSVFQGNKTKRFLEVGFRNLLARSIW